MAVAEGTAEEEDEWKSVICCDLSRYLNCTKPRSAATVPPGWSIVRIAIVTSVHGSESSESHNLKILRPRFIAARGLTYA